MSIKPYIENNVFYDYAIDNPDAIDTKYGYPIEIHDSIDDALKENNLWGVEPIPLAKRHIEAILSGKVVKIIGGEYVQYAFLVEEDHDNA